MGCDEWGYMKMVANFMYSSAIYNQITSFISNNNKGVFLIKYANNKNNGFSTDINNLKSFIVSANITDAALKQSLDQSTSVGSG